MQSLGVGDDGPRCIPFAFDPEVCLVVDSDIDDAVTPDHTQAKPWACLIAGAQEQGDTVFEVREAHTVFFDGDTKHRLWVTQIDLSQYPIGVTFIIEVTGHVEPVGAPIVHVVAGCLDALERTDTPTVEECFGSAERGPEAPLMVECQLNTIGFAGCHHCGAFAVGRCHGFFAVDCFDTGIGRSNDHVRVHVGPRGNADDIELGFGEHLVVIGVNAIGTTMNGGERLGICPYDVCKGDNRGVPTGFVAKGVLV